jgi:serine/threonine-protein kinase
VHRDLKPENLFLEERGGQPFVKILDFGISKFDVELTGNQGMTREGAAMGTPYYMPPEQVRGVRDLDARADVYALGVILYEGAAGKRPFEADSLPHLSLLIHEGKPTPIHDLRPDLPRVFSELVAQAMHADRERRFPSARELEQALAPFDSKPAVAVLDATIAADSELAGSEAVPPDSVIPAPSELSSASQADPDPKLLSVEFAAMGRTLELATPPRSRRPWIVAGAAAAVIATVVVVATRPRWGAQGSSGVTGETTPPALAESVAPRSSANPEPTVAPVVSAEANARADDASVPVPATASARAPVVGARVPVAPSSAKPPASATRAEQHGLSGSPY